MNEYVNMQLTCVNMHANHVKVFIFNIHVR